MKYNRGPLVPHSLLKLAGNVYIRHLVESRRTRNTENLSGGLLAQERHQGDRKSKARVYKIYEREEKQEKFTLRKVAAKLKRLQITKEPSNQNLLVFAY